MLQWLTVFLFMFTCFTWGFGFGGIYDYYQDCDKGKVQNFYFKDCPANKGEENR